MGWRNRSGDRPVASDTDRRIDDLIDALMELESAEYPLITATIDLRSGSDGQPVAATLLKQGVREMEEQLGTLRRDTKRSFEADREALEEAIAHASEDGALGLAYCGAAAAGILRLIETPYPMRNSIHVGQRPWLFELVRTRYLAGRSICLMTTDLSTMDITRVRYGASEASDQVDWSSHYLEKHRQRTNIEGWGGPMPGAGGHAVNQVERYVEAQRALFAAEAAEQAARFIEPGDLLVVAGPEEARAQVLNRLPDAYRDQAVETPALDPRQEERELMADLMDLVVDAQFRRAAEQAGLWFQGEYQDHALRGLAVIASAAEQGRLATLIVHEDAVDHFGTYDDARRHHPPVDAGPVEDLLQAALRQGAEVLFTREPRVLEEQEGVLGIARFTLEA